MIHSGTHKDMHDYQVAGTCIYTYKVALTSYTHPVVGWLVRISQVLHKVACTVRV